MRAFLRNPYHYLALPLLALSTLSGVYHQLFYNVILNGIWDSPFNYSSPVFPVTYGTALVVFVGLLLVLHKKVGWLVGALYAVAADVGAVGLYELVFEGFFIQSDPFPFKFFMFTFALFGLVSFRVWKVAPIELWLLIGWISLFFLWAYFDPSIPTSMGDTAPFVLNSVTKVWTFTLYAVPLLMGAGFGRSIADRLKRAWRRRRSGSEPNV